jgi:hypothetical protein
MPTSRASVVPRCSGHRGATPAPASVRRTQRLVRAGGNIRHRPYDLPSGVSRIGQMVTIFFPFAASAPSRSDTLGCYRVGSGNNPGIQRAASVAGKARRSGARVLSDRSTPRSSSQIGQLRAMAGAFAEQQRLHQGDPFAPVLCRFNVRFNVRLFSSHIFIYHSVTAIQRH